MLCQIDLFERYAPLHKQRLRVDAEGAGIGGEENDVARHVYEYKRPFSALPYPGRGTHRRLSAIDREDPRDELIRASPS